jgi:hypothetical protein
MVEPEPTTKPAKNTPLQITIYGKDDEVKSTHSISRVPWRILKAAVRMAKSINVNNLDEDDIDALAGLVVEAFDNQFSVADLENSDIGEMATVLTQIIAKAGTLMPRGANPTRPG